MASNENPDENILKIRDAQREIHKAIRVQRRSDCFKANRVDLCEVEESLKSISPDEMKNLAVSLVKSKGQLDILLQIKNGASGGDLHIEAFLRVASALDVVVGQLCSNNAEAQLEAAACITNLATGPHKCTLKIANTAGAYLITYLHGGSHFLKSQCAWACGNIAHDCETCFSILKAQGLLPALGSLLNSHHPEVVESALFALNACSEYDIFQLDKIIDKDSVMKFFERKDLPDHALVDAAFLLSSVCYSVVSEPQQQKLATLMLDQFKGSAENANVLLWPPLVRCLGNLSAHFSKVADFILQQESFRKFALISLNGNHSYMVKEIICLLTNIAVDADISEHSAFWQEVLQSLPPYVSLLGNDVLQVVYLLCVLKSRWENFETVFTSSGLSQNINLLRNSGEMEMEIAVTSLCSVSCKLDI